MPFELNYIANHSYKKLGLEHPKVVQNYLPLLSKATTDYSCKSLWLQCPKHLYISPSKDVSIFCWECSVTLNIQRLLNKKLEYAFISQRAYHAWCLNIHVCPFPQCLVNGIIMDLTRTFMIAIEIVCFDTYFLCLAMGRYCLLKCHINLYSLPLPLYKFSSTNAPIKNLV